MKFTQLATYLEKLENTSKRLEITALLAQLITEIDAEEIDKAIYMSLGYLKAQFETPKFNMAEETMYKVLTAAYQVAKPQLEEKVGRLGDFGTVAYEILQERNKTTSNLTVSQVYESLLEIATTEGTGSIETKISKSAGLLNSLDNLSAKYLVRIILGTTRLGFTELTVIAALSQCLGKDTKDTTVKDKATTEAIELKYNKHPDIGLIAKQIKLHGLAGLEKVDIDTGVPIEAQRCQRLSSTEEIIEKMGTVWAEYKFDGTRVQLHMDRNKTIKSKNVDQESLFNFGNQGAGTSNNTKQIFAKTFTRNLQETTHQFPDLIQAANEQIDADSVILDGEAIGYDRETGEFRIFQETMQRKRKHDVENMALEIPLKYFVFDILYLNGHSLMEKPLLERRALLEKILKKGDTIYPSDYTKISDAEELQEYFETAKEQNLEGIVVKSPNEPYQAGARSYAWVKFKKAEEKLLADSMDCVVLGYYYGRGQRAEFGIGKCLMGVYDPETDSYKTLTKIGTGLKEADLIKLKQMCEPIKTNQKPTNVEVPATFTPDVWVKPQIILEISGDELTISKTHSAGIALRFPRLIKFRDDKKASDATTIKEVMDLHNRQKRAYY